MEQTSRPRTQGVTREHEFVIGVFLEQMPYRWTGSLPNGDRLLGHFSVRLSPTKGRVMARRINHQFCQAKGASDTQDNFLVRMIHRYQVP
jgi:hypothetical protein